MFDSSKLMSSAERNENYLKPVNLSSLNQLAKLFATEDLNVIHDPSASTASFNPKTRTLVLPAYRDDVPKVVYHLFAGHEIGHALYTPVDGFDSPLIPAEYVVRKGYRSILNVTEDVRIEKRVKRKYPGLRADFIEGYRRLVDAGFFGDSLHDVAVSPNIADRLNVRFKLGSDVASMIPFHNDDEISFLNRGYDLESFDEAIALANDIYEYMLDNEEEPDEDTQGEDGEPDESGEPDDSDSDDSPNKGDDDSSDEGDDDSSDEGGDDSSVVGDADGDESSETITPNGDDEGDEGDDDTESSGSDSDGDDDEGDDDSSDSDSDDDGDEDGDGDVTTGDAGKSNADNPDFDPSSSTDEASRDNAAYLSNGSGSATRRCAIPFDRVDYTKHVHDTKQILEEFDAKANKLLVHNGEHGVDAFYAELTAECNKYVSSVKPIVSLMAKEFDMKKAADQHRRSSTARTGVINVGKLHAYKYEEDLFLRKSIVPNAKNHGMVMLLDLSGSMQPNMVGTLEQLINLVLFCKRVQIPFEVYGFNDGLRSPILDDQYNLDDVYIDPEVYLRKFISSDLKASKFKKALEYIFFMREFWMSYSSTYGTRRVSSDSVSWADKYYMQVCDGDVLGSTPMNDALILASGLVNNFRDKTGVQICNVVVLSDGESNPLYYRANHREDGSTHPVGISDWGTDCFLYDELTRKTESVNRRRQYDRKHQTEFILGGLKARTDARIIGFFVLPATGRAAKQELSGLVGRGSVGDSYEVLKKDGAVITGCPGYDVRFAIRGGSALNTEESNVLDSVADGAKVAQIRTAFKNGSKRKIKSRVLLKKFVEAIA